MGGAKGGTEKVRSFVTFFRDGLPKEKETKQKVCDLRAAVSGVGRAGQKSGIMLLCDC